MPYYYTDPAKEFDEHALPDVEVFPLEETAQDRDVDGYDGRGYYYAFGSIGCLWDSAPVGPEPSEMAALRAARIVVDTVEMGCGAVSLHAYRCTEHYKGEHIARGIEAESLAEAWPIKEGE